VLQCVVCFAVCCSALQCVVAVCYSVLQCVLVWCSVLQVLQCVAVRGSVLQYVLVRCNVLQCLLQYVLQFVCCSVLRSWQNDCSICFAVCVLQSVLHYVAVCVAIMVE